MRHVQCGTLRRRTGHARRRRSSDGSSSSSGRTCVYATCGTHSTTYPLPPLHLFPPRCSLLAVRINPSANYACSLIISLRQIRIVIIFKWPLAPFPALPSPSLSLSIWYFWYSCSCLHISYATEILDATLKCLHKFVFCFSVWQFFMFLLSEFPLPGWSKCLMSLSLYICVCVCVRYTCVHNKNIDFTVGQCVTLHNNEAK